jgi:hypothetical protein
MDRTSRLNAEFAIAKELLVELGMKDPEAIISKRFNERYSLKYTPDNSSEPRVITKETDRKKKIKL